MNAARTDRTDLPGSLRVPLTGATPRGRWPEDDRIEVSVLLRRAPSAERFPTWAALGALPIPRRTYLSRMEFAQRHSVASNDLEKLRRFASENSLRVEEVHEAGRLAKLAGAKP